MLLFKSYFNCFYKLDGLLQNFKTFLNGRLFSTVVLQKIILIPILKDFETLIFFRKFLKNRIVCLVMTGDVGAVIKKYGIFTHSAS